MAAASRGVRARGHERGTCAILRRQKVSFRSTPLELEFHPGDRLKEDALRAELRSERRSVEDRILAAMGLASRQRIAAGRKIDVPCIDFGSAQIVVFPGEAFVSYQLMAQQQRPDREPRQRSGLLGRGDIIVASSLPLEQHGKQGQGRGQIHAEQVACQ